MGSSLADFGVQSALMNSDHAESTNLPVQFIPTNAAESVIMTTLEPGAYTVILNGVGNTNGVGIVEVFEVD